MRFAFDLLDFPVQLEFTPLHVINYYTGRICHYREISMGKRKLHQGIAIIEVNDPYVLTEIESDAALSPFLGERLSDCCIAVQPQAVPEVVKRLQSLGHMPRVVE